MTPPSVRRPAVAGLFYPDDPDRLRADVERYVAAGGHAAGPLRAVIVPHAGYRYSGPVAGEAYARVAVAECVWRRVVIAGPTHFAPLHGIAVPSVDTFATPLGDVPLDRDALDGLDARRQIVVDDDVHLREHSLEVQLPFLLETVGAVPVVPLGVGAAAPEVVAAVLEELWDDETLVVVSTDLSHYLPYAVARERDARTSAAITATDAAAIAPHDACGAYALRGFLQLAGRREMSVREVALRSSGDAGGPRDSVVGYGAFVVA